MKRHIMAGASPAPGRPQAGERPLGGPTRGGEGQT